MDHVSTRQTHIILLCEYFFTVLELAIFPKGPATIYWKNNIRDQQLGIWCVSCYWASFSRPSQRAELGNTCEYNPCVYT